MADRITFKEHSQIKLVGRGEHEHVYVIALACPVRHMRYLDMPGYKLALLDALPSLGQRHADQPALDGADMEAPPLVICFLEQRTGFSDPKTPSRRVHVRSIMLLRTAQ